MPSLLDKVRNYLPEDKVGLIQGAYEFASKAHTGQLRMSGEPYIEHPIATAMYLADMRLDATTLAAGLLHDVMEDCNITSSELEERFGPDVARLVDGVTKLNKMDLMVSESTDGGHRITTDDKNQAENLRKMLLAMAQDIRVVLIKLADRLHNMRTLSALPPDRQLAIAKETLDIYAPLAHRLGIWDMKWQLEDLAFHYLNPDKYKEISKLLATKRQEREEYISQVTTMLKAELERAAIKAEVTGRPKHIYSIYTKTERYATQGKEFSEIYDLFAVRILVQDVKECYSALGTIHTLWHPMPGQFDDYIANAKENMYQSLHTTVMGPGGVPLEIQIRTYKMHQVAEYGVAAHWHYKEGGAKDMQFEEKMTWLRQLLEWQRDVSGAEEFLESVKTDIFPNQVFVYTPKGDVVELPAGATPIDLAYRIHTGLGPRCIGAKVNGKLVPLDYQLKNGDTVEILTSKIARGPSLDWLNPNLNYVRTAHAREKIRQWFRHQERGPNVQRGRELLHRELRRLGLESDEQSVAHLFKYDAVEDFLDALGNGTVNAAQVTGRLTAIQEKPSEQYQVATPPVGPSSGVRVLGVGDLLTRMGQCCNPLPGDEIVGFITRTRGVTIHRKGCGNIAKEDEQERLVKVAWGQHKQLFPVRVTIVAWDRVGLLRDITTLVSEEGVNIASMVTTEQDDGTAHVHLTLFTTGVGQLSRLFSKLEGVKNVISAVRTQSHPAPSGGKQGTVSTTSKQP